MLIYKIKFECSRCICLIYSACARVWSDLQKSGVARIVLENVETLEGGRATGADHSNYYMYSKRGCEIDHGS